MTRDLDECLRRFAEDREPDQLRGVEDLLADDYERCTTTFSDKREAFAVGLYLGQFLEKAAASS